MDWKLFLSTFCLVFVAELPDKTAFASLWLASRHGPLAVFTGAAAAFAIQSAVAVAFGSAIGSISPRLLHAGAGVLMILFGLAMLLRKGESPDTDGASSKNAPLTRPSFHRSALTAFLAIFVAEWGDLTQLATATLAARWHAPLTIFSASLLALWAVTAIAVTVGREMARRIPEKALRWIAAGSLGAIGMALLVKG